MGEGDTAGTTRSADTQTLPCVKQPASGKPRHSPGGSARRSVMTCEDVSAPQEGGDVYIL